MFNFKVAISIFIIVFGLNNLFAFDKCAKLSDQIIVIKNNSIVFDVVEIEETERDVQQLEITRSPLFGEAKINDDHSITFTPFEEICEEIDYLEYIVRHKDGIDTVSVDIEILCESLTIMSSFYPEEDEKMPNAFTIFGVENFPENTLYVFNNSGNEVFYSRGYSNNWNGLYQGKLLPYNKIYYYVFNDGIGQVYSGYLKLN